MAKAKNIRLTDEELKKIVEEAVSKSMNAKRIEHERKKNGLLYNTKVLLENYIKFKKYITESVKSIDDIRNADASLMDTEMLRIFGMREDDKRLRSISKSVAVMKLLMAHVDRMLEVYKTSCEGSTSTVVQRRWLVIERMYLREKKMSATQIADEFHLETRNIQEDAKRAREDLKVLLFGIEAIVSDMV